MVKTLVTEIDIDATRQQVWRILVDLPAYREWNPFIVEAAGRAQQGEELTLRMQNVGGRLMTLRPTVADVREGELLQWRGRLWMPGLLDVEHSFQLSDRPG